MIILTSGNIKEKFRDIRQARRFAEAYNLPAYIAKYTGLIETFWMEVEGSKIINQMQEG